MINEREETALHQNESENPIQSEIVSTTDELLITEPIAEAEVTDDVASEEEIAMPETQENLSPENQEDTIIETSLDKDILTSEEQVEEVAIESIAEEATEPIITSDFSAEIDTDIQSIDDPSEILAANVPIEDIVFENITEHEDVAEHEDVLEGLGEDYAHYSKEQFLTLIKELHEEVNTNKNFKKAINTLKEIKPYFDEIAAHEKEEAQHIFLAEGGELDGFDFKQDKDTKLFYQLSNQIYKNRTKYFADLEDEKNKNLEKKNILLEKIRALTEGEENQASIDELKRLQAEWKSLGAIPAQHIKSTWASYNALIDLFYNKLSIYSELKELDRRKNLAMKLSVCERAEKLADYESIQKAIKELNELHEEYKHIGPIPKEEQEILWQRFKAASDKVYDKKREFIKEREDEKIKNLELKMSICEELKPYLEFNSDRITDWNNKTKEVIDIQKRWEAIRFIPREKIKESSRVFWNMFKTFFNNKNNFIRTLDEEREQNLAQKVSLCEQAEALINSNDDRRKIADKLKVLQNKWKEIGPVPGRQRDTIFNRFKKICDDFFEKRREDFNSQEKVFEDNLKLKQELCTKIDQLVVESGLESIMIAEFMKEWKSIGFVPKKDKAKIQTEFETSLYGFVNRANTSKDEKEKLHLEIDVQLFKESPNAYKKMQQKESALRRQITKLESDIDVWKNNIGFLAHSKKADSLKQTIESQIKEATDKLKQLKKQLKIFQNLE